MLKKGLPALLVLIVFLAGCTSFLPEEPTQTPVVKVTLPPPAAEPTDLPPTSIPAEIQPTVTKAPPEAPKTVVVNTNNLNMRSGPSTLYQILATYREGAELEVTARTPGADWVKATGPDGFTGWMAVSLLNYNGDLQALPEEIIAGGVMLHGKVLDDHGEPIPGVAVAATRNLASGSYRLDAASNMDGDFYFFLPEGLPGNWQVSMVGVECKSTIVDENCNLRDHIVYFGSATVTLPPSSTIVLLFEQSTSKLTGKVVNEAGEPVANIQVRAVRSDGAYSYTLPKNTGEFVLPVSGGNWEIYSIQFNPPAEGERVPMVIEAGAPPQDVEITAP